jgi:hypothetical protein
VTGVTRDVLARVGRVLLLVSVALYLTLLGYVLNARGLGPLALTASAGALVFALLLLQEALPDRTRR